VHHDALAFGAQLAACSIDLESEVKAL
jgi:hypothetical protein